MTRRLNEGIIKAFCKYVEDTEIPPVFAIWTAISTVSSALGRDCFIDQGHFVIYPNLYLVLVAGSAICRKSSAIMSGFGFIKKIKPAVHILSQKMTPEALIGSLSGMTAKDGANLIDEAVGILVVDELSTLVDKNAFKTGMIPLLTKLFDCQDFPYETRGRGVELVRNPCLSLLGGSTMHWIKESIPQVAIGGGFTSRIIFIYKDKTEKLVPWPKMSRANKERADDISRDLNDVAKMRGSMALSENALEIYKAEYENFMRNSPLRNNINLMGYAGRRMHILLKVSMTLSASFSDSRVIDEEDIKMATELMEYVERDMPKVLETISSEYVGDVCREVAEIILNRKAVSRSELVGAMRHRLTVRQLDVILDTLIAEELVTVVETEDGKSYVIKKQ